MPRRDSSGGGRREEYEPLMGDEASATSVQKPCWTVRCLLLFLMVFVLVCAIVIVSALVYMQEVPVHSAAGHYSTAAVASDAAPCSTVGREILQEQNGSAVDAAIATLLCVGLYNPHSMGIGGGCFMTIYATPTNGTEKELVTLDAREVAPLAATEGMYYNGTSSTEGGASVAVAGEVKGYYAAWERFGRLKWSDLFQPAIRMNKRGVPVSKELAIKIKSNLDELRKHWQLRSVFLTADGDPLEEGELIRRPALTETLQSVAAGGPDVFYTGALTQQVVDDLDDCGGSIISLEDLGNYTALWKEPVEATVGKWSVASLSPPSSGAVLHFILNVMDGYGYTAMPNTTAEKVLMYHRFIETLKFGFALRTQLGDEDFVNVTEIVHNLTSRAFADDIRGQITDDSTHNPAWYHPHYDVTPEGGTSHLNVYGPDGSAVAVTSTINTEFGSKCLGSRTGIIFNNEMDDFSVLPSGNFYHLPGTAANRIEPRKRPLSSMVPSIIREKGAKGRVISVVGGSGGAHILPATSFVAYHNLWLKMTMQDAIDSPRLHHQLMPNIAKYEENLHKDIVAGLAEKGHELESRPMSAVVQGIELHCQPEEESRQRRCIEAVSDRRKYGAPDGY